MSVMSKGKTVFYKHIELLKGIKIKILTAYVPINISLSNLYPSSVTLVITLRRMKTSAPVMDSYLIGLCNH